MKKLIIITIIVALLAVGTYFGLKYYKKYADAQTLAPEVVKINIISDLSQILTGLDIRVDLNFPNFTSSQFEVSQVKLDIFTNQDVLLASQLAPLTKSIIILPAQLNPYSINFHVPTSGVLNLVTNLGITNPLTDYMKIIALATSYATTGKIGVPIKIKGFVTALIDGIEITVNLDLVQTI